MSSCRQYRTARCSRWPHEHPPPPRYINKTAITHWCCVGRESVFSPLQVILTLHNLVYQNGCSLLIHFPYSTILTTSIGWDHLWTAATNGSIVHSTGHIWEWKTPDSSTRALWQSPSSKAGWTGEGNNKFCLTKHLSHTSKGSLTCRKILRHGTEGFTSPPKEDVLQIFIALARFWARDPWVQWPACQTISPRTTGTISSVSVSTNNYL
jgi:hypothetical protein